MADSDAIAIDRMKLVEIYVGHLHGHLEFVCQKRERLETNDDGDRQ
jgi:hypothetical protein